MTVPHYFCVQVIRLINEAQMVPTKDRKIACLNQVEFNSLV
jgi:hypothetical protein